ncbi:hypothetical protein K435DRAFT_368711 [Dendrothele bispora CBS 962.96]|uniref:Uncharacterized protein n=1 Tax=Dendrothele bispora (strain CBS 962.96) TaxID=1314807 RepID=A0A4S8MHJ7_DENBC|nr:hypothetical protein K435DRAFT_368711 [Dendrothele bispora CBS 962.96]
MRYYCANTPPLPLSFPEPYKYPESRSHLLDRKYYEPWKIVSSKFPQAVSCKHPTR